MNLSSLKIGRIYRTKYDFQLKRIFRYGGGGCYSGRGCTPQTATPDNHIRVNDVSIPSEDEINEFLEKEMENGMVQTVNVKLIPTRGDWIEERSSGYRGFRCRKCAEWVAELQERRCKCDGKREERFY